MSKDSLKNNLIQIISKSRRFKDCNQGLTLRRFFIDKSNLNEKQKNKNYKFLEIDFSTLNNKEANSNNSSLYTTIDEDSIINENGEKNIYFRINIDNRHWIGCKISINKKEIKGITIFDSLNHQSKDKEIAEQIIKGLIRNIGLTIDENKNNYENLIHVKQLVKNSKNNCVFETEMSMLADAGIISEEECEKYGLNNNENDGTKNEKLKELNVEEIAKDINDEKILAKMAYGEFKNKDKKFLEEVIKYKPKNITILIKGRKINVTKIGTEYYLITNEKKVYKLEFNKRKKYLRPFKIDNDVYDYITEKLNIETNEQQNINNINISREIIQQKELLNEIKEDKVAKLNIKTEEGYPDILFNQTFGYFIVNNKNEIYKVNKNTNTNKDKYIYTIEQPRICQFKNDYFPNIKKINSNAKSNSKFEFNLSLNESKEMLCTSSILKYYYYIEYLKKDNDGIKDKQSKKEFDCRILGIFDICENYKKYGFELVKIKKDNNKEYQLKNNDDLIYDFQLEKDNEIYFSTDYHGCLEEFLKSLLISGVAKFKEDENPVIYFDAVNEKTYDTIEEYLTDQGNNAEVKNLVPIPNLVINQECKSILVCGGDIIDRGVESDVVLCLMYHLKSQDKESRRIKYVIGNHEVLSINDGIDRQRLVKRKEQIHNKLINNLINKDQAKFCYYSGNTIFSHNIFDKEQILYALEVVLENPDIQIDDSKYKYFNIEEYEFENQFPGFKKTEIENLKDKVEKGESDLNENDIKLLCDLLNELFKYYTEHKIQFGNYNMDIIFEGRYYKDNKGFPIEQEGLLTNKPQESKGIKYIKGIRQIVGHCKSYKDDKEINDGNEIKELKNNNGKVVVIGADVGLNENKIEGGFKDKNDSETKLGIVKMNSKGNITYIIQDTGINTMRKKIDEDLGMSQIEINEEDMVDDNFIFREDNNKTKISKKDIIDNESEKIEIVNDEDLGFVRKYCFDIDNENKQIKNNGFHIKFKKGTETYSCEVDENSKIQIFKVQEKRGFAAKFKPTIRTKLGELDEEKELETEFKKTLEKNGITEITYDNLKTEYRKYNGLFIR